jgi:putative phosphoribosyl transferase
MPWPEPPESMNSQIGGLALPFPNRRAAGQFLAHKLQEFAARPDVVVLALPRGGVPVAYEVAKSLRTPLDVFVVRKLGVPGQEELAMGAIASGGVRDINEDVVRFLKIPRHLIAAVAEEEERELHRREMEYRDGRPAVDVRGRITLLVDDGLATGSSMRVAAMALKKKEPAKIVVAVPVSPRETCEEFDTLVDQVVCAAMPEKFRSVGEWYEDFSQTTDEEVRELLEQSASFAPFQTTS